MSIHMRPLYIAKSIQELEKYSDINSIRIDNSKIPELIFKCFSDADKYVGSDDERAYIFYERGIKLYDKFFCVISTLERQKLTHKRSEAGKLMIALRHDLQQRYLIEEQCKLVESLPVCTEPFEVKNPKAAKEAAETKHFPGRWIPPESLYAMLMTKKPILFIDVRSQEDFEYRHIEHSCQINFGDKSQISKGITITRLEKSLSEHELPSWNHRNNVRLIVLVDEDTGEELIEHPEDAECFHLSCRNPLKIVYDALVTYNAEKDQLSPTVFLAGGIKEFSKRYPTFVTILSSRKKPSAQGEQNKADSIAYPNFTDITYVGDNMLTDENIRSTPPEMPIYSNAGILPYSELSKTLKKISVDTRATDHNYDLPPNRIATSKKTDSEKSSEEVAYPPTVDRSNKPKSDAPSVPPPSYESLSDLLSDYTEAPPTIDRSTKPNAPNQDLKATEPNSSVNFIVRLFRQPQFTEYRVMTPSLAGLLLFRPTTFRGRRPPMSS
uniref:Uncharacterized protein n=1 Tax=Schistocephalus solidus TaxID=70667 RepID=A0A0X3PV52_SCHSO